MNEEWWMLIVEGWMMKDDDFKLLRGFSDWLTDGQTNECTNGHWFAFVTEKCKNHALIWILIVLLNKLEGNIWRNETNKNFIIIGILKVNVLDMVKWIAYLIFWLKIGKICIIFDVFMSVGELWGFQETFRIPILSKKSP